MINNLKIFHQRKKLFDSLEITNTIIISFLIISSIYSIIISHSMVMMVCLGIALVMLLTSAILFYRLIMKSTVKFEGELYIKYITIYIIMLVGCLPVYVLTYTHGNPSIISEYGLTAIGALASFSNLSIPVSIILFITLCFWLEVAFITKANILYAKCHELKKTILE